MLHAIISNLGVATDPALDDEFLQYFRKELEEIMPAAAALAHNALPLLTDRKSVV